jgi:hypothetical protein
MPVSDEERLKGGAIDKMIVICIAEGQCPISWL